MFSNIHKFYIKRRESGVRQWSYVLLHFDYGSLTNIKEHLFIWENKLGCSLKKSDSSLLISYSSFLISTSRSSCYNIKHKATKNRIVVNINGKFISIVLSQITQIRERRNQYVHFQICKLTGSPSMKQILNKLNKNNTEMILLSTYLEQT